MPENSEGILLGLSENTLQTFRIINAEGKVLLSINMRTGEVVAELYSVNEAAEQFVDFVRSFFGSPTT